MTPNSTAGEHPWPLVLVQLPPLFIISWLWVFILFGCTLFQDSLQTNHNNLSIWPRPLFHVQNNENLANKCPWLMTLGRVSWKPGRPVSITWQVRAAPERPVFPSFLFKIPKYCVFAAFPLYLQPCFHLTREWGEQKELILSPYLQQWWNHFPDFFPREILVTAVELLSHLHLPSPNNSPNTYLKSIFRPLHFFVKSNSISE